jgi:hypothetical protein
MNFEFLNSHFQPVQIVFKSLAGLRLKIFPPILIMNIKFLPNPLGKRKFKNTLCTLCKQLFQQQFSFDVRSEVINGQFIVPPFLA